MRPSLDPLGGFGFSPIAGVHMRRYDAGIAVYDGDRLLLVTTTPENAHKVCRRSKPGSSATNPNLWVTWIERVVVVPYC